MKRLKPNEHAETPAQTAARLAVVAAELNAATDAYNASLRALEEAINATNIGLEASVPIFPKGAPAGAPVLLHFAKHRETGRWALVVSHEKTWWGLTDAPRPMRIAAAAGLQPLLRQLEKAATAMAADLVTSRAQADAAEALARAIVFPAPEPDPVPPKTPQYERTSIDYATIVMGFDR